MADVITFFILLASIIIIGFLGNLFFERTSLPDALWLIFFGVIIGPVLSLVDREALSQNIPIFASLALIIILFDSGLNSDMIKLVKHSSRAVILTFSAFILSVFSAAAFSYFVLGWSLPKGMLLGAVIGGTTSVTVVSILRQLKVRDEIFSLLSIESVLTDILCVVVVISILQIELFGGEFSLSASLNQLLSIFSIGAMIGLISGVFWLLTLHRIKGTQFSYMLTIAILLLLYSAVEWIKGSGAIATLAFGLILGNGAEISRMFRVEEVLEIDELIKKFETEITFFVRTFFFVYLGAVIEVKEIRAVLPWIALAFILFFARKIAAKITAIKSSFTEEEVFLSWIMMPRGLAAAALSVVPLSYGYKGAEVFPDIVFTVIITTTLITTVGVFFFRRKQKMHS